MRPPKNVPTVDTLLPKILPMMSLQTIEQELAATAVDSPMYEIIEEAWCNKYLEMKSSPLRGDSICV
jgi:hypothetical protein